MSIQPDDPMIEILMQQGYSREESQLILAGMIKAAFPEHLIDNTGLELERELVKSKKPTKKNRGFKREKPTKPSKPQKQFKSDKRIPIHKGK